MARPMWLVNLLKKNFKNRFLFARLTRQSTLVRRFIDHLIFEGDEIYYLPKDRLVINQPVEQQAEMAAPSHVVRHFIQQAAHIWKMDRCICREAESCRQYPIDLGCIMMGDAVLHISPKLGHMVAKQEALDHLERSRQAGLIHMVGRNKLDTVWAGAVPGERLLTICNCCPCCCLYQVLPDLHPSISRKITKMPGVVIAFDAAKCTGCGECARSEVCFVRAITMQNSRPVRSEICVGCGRCVEVCPHAALSLVIEEAHFIAETIQRLSQKVDVTPAPPSTQTNALRHARRKTEPSNTST